ncbi:MAG: type IV conjugative transfer system protein TraL [Alphaproteobacteria bacterium]|nr:type IV conjugative transfer system protein TraL [Alphaproteobacteria bacterium]
MSTDYDQHIILHHLDDPLRILKWTVDEAAILILPMFFGLAIDHFIVGLLMSAFGFWGLRNLKRRLGLMAVKHALYWYLPHNRRKLPTSPPSYIREYLG